MKTKQHYRYSDDNTYTDNLTLKEAREFKRMQNGGRIEPQPQQRDRVKRVKSKLHATDADLSRTGRVLASYIQERDQYKAHAERLAVASLRLAELLRRATEELSATVDNEKDGGETYRSTEAWNECVNLIVEAREALAQWEASNEK